MISNEKLREEKDAEFREQKLGFNGEIDMSKMRPTEFSSNKDLKTPGPADIRTKINLQMDRLERMDVFSEFISNFVDPQGNMKESRILTKKKERGRQETLEGIKTKGWILYNSNKSGKLVIDS